MPAISVLFPVYNAINDLPQAMRSLLNQTCRDFEVIAIDDGSTDESGEMLDEYAQQDKRIRVFHQENAGELGKVLNRGAELSRGKYLARQDADDASHPERLKNQINYLETHADTGLCGTWTWFIDASLGPLYSLEIPDDQKLLGTYLNKGMNPFVHGSVMLRTEVFQKSGGYRGTYTEDYDLWLRISELTRLGMCPSLGYYYWRSIGGISSGAYSRQQKLIQLVLTLHSERVKFGRELSNWNNEYQEIINMPISESNPAERQTLMHYARGLQLLRRQMFEAARKEFETAAAGEGRYTIKARRNLSFFWLAPILGAYYGILKWQEPERFARHLPKSTMLPKF